MLIPPTPDSRFWIPCSAPCACLTERFCAYPSTEGDFDAFWEANELVVRVVDVLAISSSILDGSDTPKHVCISAWYIASRQFGYQC